MNCVMVMCASMVLAMLKWKDNYFIAVTNALHIVALLFATSGTFQFCLQKFESEDFVIIEIGRCSQ